MGTVIEAVKHIVGKENIDVEVMGMRPGEKFHEDMLAKTELDFTYEINDKLLTVLPQYTNKNHTFKNKYKGVEFNSSLHINQNVEDLALLIKKGLEDAN